MAGRAQIAALTVAAAACGDGLTQVIVVVDTDLAVPAELDRIDLELVGPGGAPPDGGGVVRTAMLGQSGSPELPLTQSVTAGGGSLTVIAVGRRGGLPIVEREARATFAGGETRMLRVVLRRACIGVSCEEGETCGEAGCETVEEAGALEPWAGAPPEPLDAGPGPDAGPPPVPASLAVGGQHACFVDGAGAVWCWGANAEGQLGNGTRENGRTFPVRVLGLEGSMDQVVAGDYHTCALANDGMVWCWGRGVEGQLGQGASASSLAPVMVAGVTARLLAAGANHTCAIDNGSDVWCWGKNDSRQAGGTAATNPSPALVSLADGATVIAAGRSHTCAATGAAGAFCWGANMNGQLGNGATSTNPSDPVEVMMLIGVVDALACGASHSCALVAGGVFCWGFNGSGQLGIGEGMTQAILPQSVDTGLEASALAAGDGHTCAVLNDFTVSCWGRNDRGQLGDGTIVERAVPGAVISLSNITDVGGGIAFSCARRNTPPNTISCWGDDSVGQLGRGASSNEAQPEPAPIVLSP